MQAGISKLSRPQAARAKQSAYLIEREVKFSLTDKELSLSRENLIADHFAPAFYAIADDIDQNLALRANDIPYFYFFCHKMNIKKG